MAMEDTPVLVKGSSSFTKKASDLIAVAGVPILKSTGKLRFEFVLHELRLPKCSRSALKDHAEHGVGKDRYRKGARKARPRSADLFLAVFKGVKDAASKVNDQYPGREIIFCLRGLPDQKYISLVAKNPDLVIANTTSSAVAKLLWRMRLRHATLAHKTTLAAEEGEHRVPALATEGIEVKGSPRQFVMDSVKDIDSLGHDLRDDESGRLDAKKIAVLFGVSVPDIAEAAGVSRQALDKTPASVKAQPLLQLFERIARLRAHPQFKEDADVCKWFDRPLPIFKDHSAKELFKTGKLDVVAQKVDQLLTGDFGG